MTKLTAFVALLLLAPSQNDSTVRRDVDLLNADMLPPSTGSGERRMIIVSNQVSSAGLYWLCRARVASLRVIPVTLSSVVTSINKLRGSMPPSAGFFGP